MSGDAPTATAELLAVVGISAEGGSEFGHVRSAVLDARGSLYVLDASLKQVTAFDGGGRRRGPVGRVGAGPGEYRTPYSIALLGDSIAIFDPGLSRITLLAPDGTWLRDWRTPPNTGPQIVRLYRTPPSSFWAYATTVGDAGLERVVVQYRASGPTDTLPLPAPAGSADLWITCTRPDGSFASYPRPFEAPPLMVPTPAGERATVSGTAYRVTFLDRRGDTLRRLERAVDPAHVSDAEWAAASAEWREFRAQRPDAFCTKDGFDRPATRSSIEMIFFDDAGQMWVEARTAGGRSYDVYTPDWRLRATIVGLPPSAGIEPSVAAGRIALVVADSLGEQSVQVYRVPLP